MDWLVPAVIATLTSAIILFLVYAHLHSQERDDKFLATWTVGWGFYSCRFIFIILILMTSRYPAFLAGNQLCSLWSGYFLLLGTNQFAGRPTSRWWLLGSLAGSLWILGATFGGVPFLWLTLPTFSFMALVFLWTGRVFLRFKGSPGIGHTVVGCAFLLWGLHKFNYPFLQPIKWFAPWGYLLGALLALVTALGIILVYFQKTKSDLIQSEQRFRQLAEHINDVFWVGNADWSHFFYVSPAYREIWGRDPQSVLDDPGSWLEMVHPDDRPVLWAEIEKVQDTSFRHATFAPYRVVRDDGSQRWMEARCYSVDGPGGQPERVVGVVTDITARKQAEEALRASRDSIEWERNLLQEVMNGARNIHLVYLDRDFNFVRVNQVYAHNCGYQPEEMIGKNHFALYPHPENQDIFTQVRDTGEAFAVRDKPFTFPDQPERGVTYWDWSLTPIKDPDGQVAGLVFSLVETTNRKKAEEELARATERLQLAMRFANDGLFDWDLVNDEMYYSPGWKRLVGYEDHEIENTFAAWEAMTHEEDVARARVMIMEVVKGTRERFETEVRMRHKDGHWVDILARANVVRDETGRGVRVVGTHVDISARKRAEAALRESELTLKKAQQVARIGSWSYDPASSQPTWTEQMFRVFGLEPADQVPPYSQHTDFIHPDDWPKLDAAVSRAIKKGVGYNLDLRVVYPDGEIGWVNTICEPEVNQDGKVTRLLGTAQDITGLKQAEARRAELESQLRQAQKMEAIGTLAGGIAHDFNNILGSILGYAEMARDDARNNRANPEDIEQIIAAAEKAKRLIQQILTFSRRVDPQRKPLDLNTEIKHSMELLGHTLPKMISRKLNLAPDLKHINADPGQINQVILNLATNASHAMPEGGNLSISTENIPSHQGRCQTCGKAFSGEWVGLRISDNGQGIAPEDLPKIFDPFFTTKEVGKGTGLGLATVYGIVLSHGGHIECDSRLNRGTSFLVYLPPYDGEAEAGRSGPEQETCKLPGGSETILLVDDEENLRKLGTRTLKAMGYEVATAASGEEALEIYRLRGQQLDLVIMDLGMPGIGGHKAMKDILRINPQEKVIIASGYSADGRAKGALEDGAAGYVGKPFHRSELLTTVRRVLDAH